MAGIEDMLEGGNIGPGLIVGAGALLLGPTLIPIVGRIARPLINGVLESGRVMVNEISRGVGQIGDYASEAGERWGSTAAAGAGAAGGSMTAGMSQAGQETRQNESRGSHGAGETREERRAREK
jgi:hypothetical protein